MIKIDFSSAISIYLSFSIVLVFALWLFYNLNRSRSIILNETKYLHQCPYCTYIFFNYRPRAESPEKIPFEVQKKGETLETTAEEAVSGNTAASVLVCPRCKSYINLDTDDQKGEH